MLRAARIAAHLRVPRAAPASAGLCSSVGTDADARFQPAASTAPPRPGYAHVRRLTTQFADQDCYLHVNNAVYLQYFDSVINAYLIKSGVLDLASSGTVGLCIESKCVYSRPLEFPDDVDAALRVGYIGNSSVRYEVGLFGATCDELAASGHFVHVFVDRETRRPVPIEGSLKKALQHLFVER